MWPSFWMASGIRWLSLTALAALLGGLAVEVAVLVGASVGVTSARRRLERWNLLAGVGLLTATIGEFAVRVQVMAGGPFEAMVRAVPAVLTQTHFGPIWVTRIALLAATVALCVWPSRSRRVMALMGAIGVALTQSLTGHAAQWGDLSVSIGADWVHVVTSGVWGGGLCAMAWGVFRLPAMRASPDFVPVVRRFSRLAGFAVLAVSLSGIYTGWLQLGSIDALWLTGYGRVLLVKILLVGVVLYIGAGNRYAMLPRLAGRAGPARRARPLALVRALAGTPPATPRVAARALIARVRKEAVLVLVVLACAAILAESTPARHAGHSRQPEATYASGADHSVDTGSAELLGPR